MRYLVIILLLAACQTETYKRAKSGFFEDTKDARKSAAQHIYPERKDLQPPPEPIIEEKYCYKAWTGVNCYNVPQEGQEDRRIGTN